MTVGQEVRIWRQTSAKNIKEKPWTAFSLQRLHANIRKTSLISFGVGKTKKNPFYQVELISTWLSGLKSSIGISLKFLADTNIWIMTMPTNTDMRCRTGIRETIPAMNGKPNIIWIITGIPVSITGRLTVCFPVLNAIT